MSRTEVSSLFPCMLHLSHLSVFLSVSTFWLMTFGESVSHTNNLYFESYQDCLAVALTNLYSAFLKSYILLPFLISQTRTVPPSMIICEDITSDVMTTDTRSPPMSCMWENRQFTSHHTAGFQ